ncbi:MAG: ComF family protein [Ruminococcaceae bacterium]|nr:ComF family protein [Oscillospiraceae bacterium]
MTIKDAKQWVMSLLFPPICRACGERQNIFAPRQVGVLCTACHKTWQGERGESCSACGNGHENCSCIPSELQKIGVETFVHLAPYRPGKPGAASAMILRGKDNNDREMFRFLAAELSEPVRRALGEDGEAVVTYVPRRRAAVQATGHDHAKQIAGALADELALPLVIALRRRPMTRQQKELSAAQREKNAARSFELADGQAVKDKTVVLFDDVCTTGTSLGACASHLLEAGAGRVVCAVIAKTESGE